MSELDPKPPPGDGTGPKRQAPNLERVSHDLKELIISMRRDREQRAAKRAHMPAMFLTPEPAAPSCERENWRPAEALARTSEALERRRESEERLREQAMEIELEYRRISDEYVAVQEQCAGLANLCAALMRLHESLQRREVLAAIQEIIVNLVGSEELEVYELPSGGDRLVLAHAFGERGRAAEVSLGAGVIGHTAATGEIYIAGSSDGVRDPDLTACIPLKMETRVTGAIAVYRLLSHKRAIDPADRQIFELLGDHAARALHCAALQEKADARVGH